MTWDVIIYDTKSAPFSSRIVRDQPIGSTELCLAQLAEQIAARGRSVLVLNKLDRVEVSHDGGSDVITYAPAGTMGLGVHDCRTLILSRDTPRPHGIRADRTVVYGSDNARFGEPGADVYVAVSEWHRRTSQYQDRTIVIPPMIADEVYALRSTPKEPGRFIFASAWNKGGDLTVCEWATLREHLPGAHLVVTTGGYDEPSELAREVPGWTWLGLMPPRRIAEEVAKSEAMFYVNKDPETFCGIAAIAEAVGCRLHVLCVGDPGALPETVSAHVFTDAEQFRNLFRRGWWQSVEAHEPKDYRVSTLMPRWMEVLGLEG